MRTQDLFTLNFRMYHTAVLAIVMLYITLLVFTYNWKFVSFDHFPPIFPTSYSGNHKSFLQVCCFSFLIPLIREIIQYFVFLWLTSVFCYSVFKANSVVCCWALDLTVCLDRDCIFCFQFGKLSVHLFDTCFWNQEKNNMRGQILWDVSRTALLSGSSVTRSGSRKMCYNLCEKWDVVHSHLELRVTRFIAWASA